MIVATPKTKQELQELKAFIKQDAKITETQHLQAVKADHCNSFRKAKNFILKDQRDMLRYTREVFNMEIADRKRDQSLVKIPERVFRTAGSSMKLLEKKRYLAGIKTGQVSQADIDKLNKPSNAYIIDIVCALLEDGFPISENDESIHIEISFNDFCKITGADLHGTRRREIWESIKNNELLHITLIGTLQDGGIYKDQSFIQFSTEGEWNESKLQKIPHVLDIRLDKIAFSYFFRKGRYTLIDRNLSKKLERINKTYMLIYGKNPPLKLTTQHGAVCKMFDQWDTGRQNRKGSMHISLKQLIAEGKIPKPRSRQAKDEIHGFLCNALISLSRETKRPNNPYAIRGEIIDGEHMIIFDPIAENGQKMLDFQ